MTKIEYPSRFERYLQVILEEEGGYVNHPKDPGKATNKGITKKTLTQWRGTRVTNADVKNLKMSEVRAIYYHNYYIPAHCNQLPESLGLEVFDCAVNQGVLRAKRFVQSAVRVKVDGFIGPITLAAVERHTKADEERLIREFMVHRILHYSSLYHFTVFGLGWMRRVLNVYGKALLLTTFIRSKLK